MDGIQEQEIDSDAHAEAAVYWDRDWDRKDREIAYDTQKIILKISWNLRLLR
jgi:hypothetical protein